VSKKLSKPHLAFVSSGGTYNIENEATKIIKTAYIDANTSKLQDMNVPKISRASLRWPDFTIWKLGQVLLDGDDFTST